MKKLFSILRLDFLPANVDVALLALRLWVGGSMLVLHGWDKLSNFQGMARRFPSYFGLNREATLGLALVGEVLCPIFLILGVFYRIGAVGAAFTMGMAFFVAHKGVLKGDGNGEMAFIYMAAFVTMLIAGPGKYAIEGGGKGRSAGPKKPKPAKE